MWGSRECRGLWQTGEHVLCVMGTARTQLWPVAARLESNLVLTNPISQEELGSRCV